MVCIGICLGVAVAIYAASKSYPENYDAEGKLIVDGAKMANDTFKGIGYCVAFLVGWMMERRFVGFSTDIPAPQKLTRAVVGLLGVLFDQPDSLPAHQNVAAWVCGHDNFLLHSNVLCCVSVPVVRESHGAEAYKWA